MKMSPAYSNSRYKAAVQLSLLRLQEVDVYDDWMDADIFEDFDIDFAEDAFTGIAVSGDLPEVCCAVWSIFAMTVCPSSTAFHMMYCVPCSSLV